MSTLITIISLVVAILQIILFFKLWGMTNDISKIKGKIEKNSLFEIITVECLKGNKEKVKELLDEAFYLELIGIRGYYNYDDSVNSLIEHYEKVYNRFGVNSPDFEIYKDKWNVPYIEGVNIKL